MKKVKKDIIYCTLEEAKEGNCDIALTVDGQNLIDEDADDAIKILRQYDLVKDDAIIIPAGMTVTNITQYGGALEYEFNNGYIIVDLAFDDEDEYLEDINE